MQDITAKLVDANTLKHNNAQKRQVKEFVTEIILQINKELKDARRDGRHFIISEIPFIFNIPNLTEADASRMIWSEVIQILKNKNFIVAINYNNNSCRLKISWLAPEEERTIQKQLQILDDHTEDF